MQAVLTHLRFDVSSALREVSFFLLRARGLAAAAVVA